MLICGPLSLRIPQTSKTKYTTNTNSLNPNFITGFCDAEASFTLNINKDPRYASG